MVLQVADDELQGCGRKHSRIQNFSMWTFSTRTSGSSVRGARYSFSLSGDGAMLHVKHVNTTTHPLLAPNFPFVFSPAWVRLSVTAYSRLVSWLILPSSPTATVLFTPPNAFAVYDQHAAVSHVGLISVLVIPTLET